MRAIVTCKSPPPGRDKPIAACGLFQDIASRQGPMALCFMLRSAVAASGGRDRRFPIAMLCGMGQHPFKFIFRQTGRCMQSAL
ncbi:MAG: hypothetical protein V4709_07925 [Pseudomonadota bacterium]